MKSGNFPFPGFGDQEEKMTTYTTTYSSLRLWLKLRQVSNSSTIAYLRLFKSYPQEFPQGITYDRETGNFPILTVLTVLSSSLRKVLIRICGISTYEA